MPDGSNHADLLATSSLSQLGHSDAPLLESYARWLPLERERLALNTLYNARQGDEPAPKLDARYERYTDHWHDQATVIRDTPATTPEGLKAKLHIARSVLDALTYLGQPSKGDDWTTGEQFAWAALKDALPVDPAATNPMLEGLLVRRGGDYDAALLAACAAFTAIETTLYALDSGVPDVEHRLVLDRYHDAYTAVDAIRPVTLAGLRAKTRVMQSGFAMQEIDGTDEDAVEWQIRGAWHLFQDIAAFGSPAPAPVAPSDPDSLVATASVSHIANGDLARAFQHFVAVDRRYDEGADTRAEEIGFVQEWDASLSGIAAAPAHSVTDCATKAMALLASIRREMSDGQTEADLSPQLALAWRMAKDLVGLTGGVPTVDAPSAGHTDAELLVVCTAYHELQASLPKAVGLERVFGTDECRRYENRQAETTAQVSDLVDRAALLSARTLDGMQAKAGVLLHWDDGRLSDGDDNVDHLNYSLVRDVLAMPPTPVSANADACLIAAAETFIVTERRMRAMPCDAEYGTSEDKAHVDQMDALCASQQALAASMLTMRAVTIEGIAARARALATHNPNRDFAMDSRDTTTGMLVDALIRDAGALDVSPTTNPDAKLIKLCEQFIALEDQHSAVFADPQAQGEDPVVSAATGKIMDKQLRLARRMAKLRAHTAEGYEALAKALLAWAPDTSKDQNDLIDGLLMRTLLCSLTGGRA